MEVFSMRILHEIDEEVVELVVEHEVGIITMLRIMDKVVNNIFEVQMVKWLW
jgi:GTP-binding protein EngB required for normal cell division